MKRIALLSALAVALFSSGASARAAESYGELSHFGSAGTSHGQLRLTGATINGTDGTRAFGVLGAENIVYVGDEPKAKEYRIQALTSAGVFLAATTGFKPPNRQGIEGIAFDPTLKRLYVLALERRGLLEIDPQKAAAGSLYAFSTDAAGEVLPPASGTVEGVLTGPTAFKSQSNVLGDALLKPKGIAVDPTSHDVIVMGELDEGGEAPSIAFQRVDASSGALGARYVDRSGVLVGVNSPNSPVVSPGGAVYIEQTPAAENVAQVVRIPSDFTSAQSPTPFIEFVSLGPQESEANAVVVFANGSGAESLEGGGGLSLSPEAGDDATIYAQARVWESDGAGGGAPYIGALAFKDVGDSEGFELGWSGGQSRQTTENCAVGTGGPTAPMVAGGAAGTVFILDPKFARVDELGPGGSGCPTADAGEIVATVNGTPLSGSIPAGTEVTLATNLTRANALAVEWSFGEGEAKPLVIGADEYQNTHVTHRFEKGGELTVTETIHTDNLSTPTIVRTIEIPVTVSHLPPNAVITGPLAIGVSEPAKFDGSASWDPNGAPGSSPIESYRWDFGDGESETSETPEITHVYAKTGLYLAKLVVVDGYGLESPPSEIEVTVAVPAPPPPEVLSGPLVEPGGVLPPPSTPESPTSPTTPPLALAPDTKLVGAKLTVAANGAVTAVLTCPAGESLCEGSLTLSSTGPVRVGGRSGKARRPAVLTFATGTFAIAGGERRPLKLRLSQTARGLLEHTNTLRARVLIRAHDATGATHLTRGIVTLRIAHSGGKRR